MNISGTPSQEGPLRVEKMFRFSKVF